MKTGLFKLIRNWGIHFLIIWGILLLATLLNYIYYKTPAYQQRLHNANPSNSHLTDLLIAALFLFLTELNYSYIFGRFKWPVFLLSSFVLSATSFAIMMTIYPERLSGLFADVKPVVLMTGYAFVYALVRDYFYLLVRKKDIQLQNSKNELDALKSQLNPHFLFNSLNYLYGTALNENAPHTADGIDTLAEMMRYTITGVHENFVPVENELKFISHYLELQQARLPVKESISIKIHIDTPSQSLQIAPLLLLPFIENAFKYGISMDEPCFVEIKIDVKDNQLVMEVNNSIIGDPVENKGNNTGIKNTIKRMDLLYPDSYKLTQTNTGNKYTTLLTLTLKR